MRSFRYLLPALALLGAACTRGKPAVAPTAEEPATPLAAPVASVKKTPAAAQPQETPSGKSPTTKEDRQEQEDTVPAQPRGEDKVLVAGESALTLHTVQLYQRMWQWYCDLRLTPEQLGRHQGLFVAFWEKAPLAERKHLLADYSTTEKEWRATLGKKKAGLRRERVRMRDQWMGVLRKSRDEVSLYMVEVYDDAHKPGGAKNAVLATGEPALTQVLMDQRILFVEWLLDLPLSERDCREYQRLFVKCWNADSQANKAELVKFIQGWGEGLPRLNAFESDIRRALLRPMVEALWEKSPDADDRWLLDQYRSAYKVGGTRDP